MASFITTRSYYKEDVALAGESALAFAGVISAVTVTNDTGSAGVIVLHDAASSTAASRKIKVVAGANSTVHLTFPYGRKFDTAVFVKPNVAGLDLAVDYE